MIGYKYKQDKRVIWNIAKYACTSSSGQKKNHAILNVKSLI
jgi:hypothetical protein